ncbi:hypothetical protein [uncultured Legionella sp.]|uniref:hypothetical protein n=1 Tax=uncultured Legionella sp. TaxID=210934 RepID=UPI002630357A|nr:hypothetical protein [uncultured Legionella sp.]
MGIGLKKVGSFIGVYGIYCLFIGLILSIIFSAHPVEYTQYLMTTYWFKCLVVYGVVLGAYLSSTSCLYLGAVILVHIRNNSLKHGFSFFIEFLLQMIWMVLPIGILEHASFIRNQDQNLAVFCVTFVLSLAVFRRRRLPMFQGAC